MDAAVRGWLLVKGILDSQVSSILSGKDAGQAGAGAIDEA